HGAERASRVAANVRHIVEALDHTRLAIDGDHNFATHKCLVKIVPYVVHRAHEACKTLGGHLEAELRTAVIARLSHLRRLRGLRANDVALLPVNLRHYLERTTVALRKRAEEDPGAYLR